MSHPTRRPPTPAPPPPAPAAPEAPTVRPEDRCPDCGRPGPCEYHAAPPTAQEALALRARLARLERALPPEERRRYLQALPPEERHRCTEALEAAEAGGRR